MPFKVKLGDAIANSIVEAATNGDAYCYCQMMQQGTLNKHEFVQVFMKF